jgi:AcrR family transcriptional regulator
VQHEAMPRALGGTQRARRQRMVDAAVTLGAEGGYDAVQMRAVAARAEVALGTLYRYFGSKDHLLAAAFVAWMERFDELLGVAPPHGATASERVLDVVDRGLRRLDGQQELTRAMVRSLVASDPGVVECQREVARVLATIVERAIGRSVTVDQPERAETIGQVWFAALVGWATGARRLAEVHQDIAAAVRLLLAPAGGTVGRSA